MNRENMVPRRRMNFETLSHAFEILEPFTVREDP
jgi:hypothetical protein